MVLSVPLARGQSTVQKTAARGKKVNAWAAKLKIGPDVPAHFFMVVNTHSNGEGILAATTVRDKERGWLVGRGLPGHEVGSSSLCILCRSVLMAACILS